MNYVKKEWQSGDTITSAALNNIENGIEAATIEGEATVPLQAGTEVETNVYSYDGQFPDGFALLQWCYDGSPITWTIQDFSNGVPLTVTVGEDEIGLDSTETTVKLTYPNHSTVLSNSDGFEAIQLNRHLVELMWSLYYFFAAN